MVAGAMERGGETGKTGDWAILEFIKGMTEESLAGDATGLSTLEAIAKLATAYLMTVPADRLKPLAKDVASWPVLATKNPSWNLTARRYLAAIELGACTIKGRISDLAYTGGGEWRQWARCAVETLDSNRRTFKVSQFRKMALAGAKPAHFEATPAWALKCRKLPPFTRNSARKWATLGREMIRTECEHLEKHVRESTLKGIREGLARRGKDTPGHVRAAILDKIAGAILTISKESPQATVT